MLTHSDSRSKRPARVILLGGAGFIGSYLAQRLEQDGIETCLVGSSTFDLSSGDGRERLVDALRPTDSMIMLATLRPGRHLDEDAFLANVAMASNVCHAVRAKGCAHLVYVSSDSVYPFDPVSITEQTPPSATSLYPLMHLARESMLGQIDGTPTGILRVTQVYGYGDPHNAYGPNRMIRSAVREGRIALFGSGEETRDHIHVTDVARLITSVLKFRSHGVMNVATGRSVSFLALAEMVKDACGGDVFIGHEPRKMPVFYRQFDTTLLRTAFPAFEFISIEQGIAMVAAELRREFLNERAFKEGGDPSSSDDQLEGGMDIISSTTEALVGRK